MSDIIGMSKILEQCRIFADSEEGKISSVWRNVVSRIKSTSETSESDELSDKRIPLGERLAANTRVVDLKKGVLIIESDHPGWIQYLKFYQKFILKGLQMESPDLKIKSFAFRLTDPEENPTEVYQKALQKAKEELMQQDEIQEKQIENYFKPEKKNVSAENQLPQELLSKIESIRKSMLTNSDK